MSGGRPLRPPRPQGPSTRQSSPESPVPSRDPPNTDEHLYVVDLRDPGDLRDRSGTSTGS